MAGKQSLPEDRKISRNESLPIPTLIAHLRLLLATGYDRVELKNAIIHRFPDEVDELRNVIVKTVR